MSRVKTFDSTGVAPNGVFYAGDANAIQDHYADLANFSQTVDIGTLRVAESGLQFVRYSSSPLEARVTAALRADGIVRGLSGLFAGTYTTAARDAIALGSRPYGLVILNTTTNQLEINLGSDTTPAWAAVGANALPIGACIPYTGSEGSVPAGFGLADGTNISRTTYSALNALYSAQGYPFGTGDGSTTFGKPDMRGRTPTGRDNMGGTVASRMTGVNTMGASGGSSTQTLAVGDMPLHDHGGLTGSSTSGTTAPGTGTESVGHSHNVAGSTGGQSNSHQHNMSMIRVSKQGGTAGVYDWLMNNIGYDGLYGEGTGGPTGAATADHSHSFNVNSGSNSVGHTHSVNLHSHSIPQLTITAQGGGAGHNNLQPYLACNWIVKLI